MQAPVFRSRSATELLDAAFQVLRARYDLIVAASLLISLPSFILQLVIPPGAERVTDAVHGLLLSYAGAAAVVIVSDAYLGQTRSLGQVLRAVFSRFGTLWGTAFIKNVMISIGLLLLVVPGVIAFIATFAMVPAVMLEGLSTSDAFSRSRTLAKGNQARIFWTLVLAFVLVIFASMGLVVAVGLLALPMGGLSDPALDLLMQVIFSAVYPFVAMVSVLLYYDARIRNEGFDIEMLMEDARGLGPAEAVPAT
jgi:hypothetical protein